MMLCAVYTCLWINWNRSLLLLLLQWGMRNGNGKNIFNHSNEANGTIFELNICCELCKLYVLRMIQTHIVHSIFPFHSKYQRKILCQGTSKFNEMFFSISCCQWNKFCSCAKNTKFSLTRRQWLCVLSWLLFHHDKCL